MATKCNVRATLATAAFWLRSPRQHLVKSTVLRSMLGCGKSALIDALAAATGNAREMVRLQLDDQVDAKSLLGAYVWHCRARRVRVAARTAHAGALAI